MGTRRPRPRLAPGADLTQLDAALTGHADAARDARTRIGLRADQAAAALSALTDGRRVSVINAPAGAGTLADVIPRIARTDDLWRTLLVDNPQRLY